MARPAPIGVTRKRAKAEDGREFFAAGPDGLPVYEPPPFDATIVVTNQRCTLLCAGQRVGCEQDLVASVAIQIADPCVHGCEFRGVRFLQRVREELSPALSSPVIQRDQGVAFHAA